MSARSPRRIRYSIRGLLLVLSLTAFACFWVTWPKRTADNFVLEYFGRYHSQTNPFREGSAEAKEFEANYRPTKRELKLVPHNRSVVDLLLSRQTFDCEMHEFTICRGSVVYGPTEFWDSYYRYYR